MARWTARQQADAVRCVRGLRLRALVPIGSPLGPTGAGLVLSTRSDTPAVLGLGVVDQFGDTAVVALDAAEATELRDHLTVWLAEQ